MIQRVALYCTCCGGEKLAEQVAGNLVIKATRHGVKHILVYSLTDRTSCASNNVIKVAPELNKDA